MVTTDYVQGIFRRQHWSYQVDDDGDIHTGFDGVPMIIFVRPNDVRVATIVYRTPGRAQQSMRSHGRDVDLLLASINAIVTDGYLEYDQQDTVFFSTPVPMTGNVAQDESLLVHGLQLTVLAAKGVGPAIYQILTGQITVQQALEAIDRAVRENQRGRGRGAA
jgi:hypothetical protein